MRNARKQIIINPAFQIRFSLLFTLAVLVFASIFPIFVWTVFESMENHSLFSRSTAAIAAFQQARSEMALVLIVLGIVTAILAFALAIFTSHRIAGPLYKLRISMVAMQQGVLNQHIKFRTKDNFQELADGFNAMTDAIFIRRRRDFERVHSVIPKLERLQSTLTGHEQAAVTEVLNALQEISRELPLK